MCKHCPNMELPERYFKDLPCVFRRTMRDLYAGKIKPEELSDELVQLLARELWSGVNLGYGSQELGNSGLAEVLKHNVFVFSGFKTYQQLQEASLLMVNPTTGNLRPFTEFMKDALAINETYNINYLQAEYNHAVASAQQMAAWKQIWEAREAVPFLKYKTAEDERVRESHRTLNDVVRPVEDKFWDTYYPPNGWNCRCVVIPVVSASQEELEQMPPLPNLPPMYRTNVGKTKTIFPDTHPYYDLQKSISDKVHESIKRIEQ